MIPTLFYTIRNINYGDSLYILGSDSLMGNWKFNDSVELIVANENIWYTVISLPENETVEYKFCQSKSQKKDSVHIKWDEGFNRKITVKALNHDPTLNVMSFNIRYDNENDGDNSWKYRKELVVSIILSNLPDLLGVQESKPSQTNFLKEQLGNIYYFYGRGRDYNDSDECVGIFYNKKRFVALDKGTFWLSDKRYQPGSVLENSYFPRISSWAKFFDDYKKQFVWYFNTHFDHLSASIRKRNAEILLDEIEKICGLNENIILSGDFNANDGEDCINLIKKRLSDSCKNSEYTFHNFWGLNIFIGKIDFIFIGKNLECSEFKNIKTTAKIKGKDRYPSDHYPIKALLKYK